MTQIHRDVRHLVYNFTQYLIAAVSAQHSDQEDNHKCCDNYHGPYQML